jgi:hypothetical protein
MTDAATTTPPPVRKGKILEPVYNAMEDAPDDGKAIILYGAAGESTEGFWRHTRTYDRNGGKWRITGFWAIWGSGGQRLLFEPIGWLPKQGIFE